MELLLDREFFSGTLQTAQKFTSDRLSTDAPLQGVFIKVANNKADFFATNLNTYCHISANIKSSGEAKFIIEPKKILEYLQLLESGDLSLTISENSISIEQGKTKGIFPTMPVADFPLPPEIKDKPEKISREFLLKNLPLLLFTASVDESRPVLTGINFTTSENDLILVATDGFRLSLVKEKSRGIFPSMIIPADFLREIVRLIKGRKDIEFVYSEKEQMVRFTIGDIRLSSRLIDGQFPAYERVIPEEKKSTVKLKKDELIRNTKLISIFAREFSNVIVFSFSSKGLVVSPKKEANAENVATQDVIFEGEPMKIAFNFRYILDFLNNTNSNEIEIELLRSDAPVLFRTPDNPSSFHIIMPVRIQD